MYKCLLFILSFCLTMQSGAYLKTSFSCKPDERAIMVSNTLDHAINIYMQLGHYKNKALAKISKEVPPGGMHTVCVSIKKPPRWFKAYLDSSHSDHAILRYTFDDQHLAYNPIANIIITDKSYYPPIL